MKNIILIISLLFYSFSVVNAQKYVFFKSPWKGDVTVAKESKGGLNMPTITVPERCWHMDASLQDISIYKDVQLNDANKTIWCSFLALKEKGNSHLGLSFEKDNDKKILVEEGINGREVECAVLGNEDVQSSCVGEIRAADEFYSYDAKYKNQESKTLIPAEISKEKSEEIRKLAVKAFKSIDGKGLSRVDFFIENGTEKVYINEINKFRIRLKTAFL